MNESNVVELKASAEDALGELLKEGARQLLAQAIEAEVAELLIQYASAFLHPLEIDVPG